MGVEEVQSIHVGVGICNSLPAGMFCIQQYPTDRHCGYAGLQQQAFYFCEPAGVWSLALPYIHHHRADQAKMKLELASCRRTVPVRTALDRIGGSGRVPCSDVCMREESGNCTGVPLCARTSVRQCLSCGQMKCFDAALLPLAITTLRVSTLLGDFTGEEVHCNDKLGIKLLFR